MSDLLASSAELAAHWNLTLGPRLPGGSAGEVRAVTRADGTPAVLKISKPHREARCEVDALAAWIGNGAIRLLERDDDRWAMLLERCHPGTPLAAAGADLALDVLADLLPRLWIPDPAGPFDTLAEESRLWLDELPAEWEESGRAYDRRLLDVALELLAWLPGTQGEQVLVNQDLHGDNVIAAEREPWLLIDPKPLLGEREFAVAPIVRSGELGFSRTQVLGRLDRLCGDHGLDRDRAKGWTIAQTMAWVMDEDGDPYPGSLELVEWLLAD
ncbi:aminoglycoside phosphotransferase family protein [Microlunatus speluncae]|uniref:aminoglycoside phosphotransferase family protein n=1 Tax=Microlunatus speluncae TaxID=2594267 RepID=UPI0012663322|nr:aminoglycoside phosphotransferase family protein [Microlunatus speluncae]